MLPAQDVSWVLVTSRLTSLPIKAIPSAQLYYIVPPDAFRDNLAIANCASKQSSRTIDLIVRLLIQARNRARDGVADSGILVVIKR